MGVAPLKKEWLKNAVDANGDGWGILVRNKDGNIIVNRGFDDNSFIELGSLYGEDFDVVAHARISTGGGVNLKNLHPFPIYADRLDKMGVDQSNDAEPEAYLFHNGIISVIPEWDKSMNDTWHLARIWEMTYGSEIKNKMRRRGWRRRQKKYLGTYNKFVLVDKNGFSIINPNAGQWVDGVWHSNDSALKPPVYSTGTYGGCYGAWSSDDDDYMSYADWKSKHDWQPVSADSTNKAEVALANEPGLKNRKGYWAKNASGGFRWVDTEKTPKIWKPGDTIGNVLTSPKVIERDNDFAMPYSLIEEWTSAATTDEIEETVFNYDSRSVAQAVEILMKKANIYRANYERKQKENETWTQASLDDLQQTYKRIGELEDNEEEVEVCL